jgi:hypothetical protein
MIFLKPRRLSVIWNPTHFAARHYACARLVARTRISSATPFAPHAMTPNPASIHDLTLLDPAGHPLPLRELAGGPSLLIFLRHLS